MQNPVQSNPLSEEVERHSRKNIFLGSVLGYVSLIINIVAGIIFTRWVIHAIGNSAYALYGLSNSIIGMFVVDLGLGYTSYTFLSKYRAEGNIDAINHFLGVIYKVYFIIAAILFVTLACFYFAIPYVYKGLTTSEINQLKIVYIISGLYTVVSFPAMTFRGIINAYEEYIGSKLIDLANKILYIVFTAAAIYLGWGLIGLVTVNAAAGLICWGLRWILIKKKTPVKSDFKFKATKSMVSQIVGFTVWSAISMVFLRFYLTVIPNILGIVSNSDNIAIFNLASSLETYVYSFAATMNSFFLPKVSRIYANDSKDKKRQLIQISNTVGKIELTMVALVFVGFVSCGREFILAWTGKPLYEESYIVTILLIVPFLLEIPEIVVNTAMYTNNKVKNLAFSSGVGAVVNVALCFFLGKFMGAIGAALGYCIGKTVCLLFENYYYEKDLGFNFNQFFAEIYIKPCVVSIFCIAVAITIKKVLNFGNLWNFVIIGSIVCILYLIGTIFFIYDKTERDSFKKMLRKK
jgi:O-antigen/teichoic acid export membrane protein